MEDVDIYILIPSTIPLSIMEFIIVLKMLDVYKCLKIPANLPPVIVDFIKVLIKVVTILEVDIGLNIPANLNLAIIYQ